MNTTARRIGERILNGPGYPFLVSTLPVVHFYELNFRILPARELLRPLLLAVVVVAVCLALGRLFWRGPGAAALVLTPFLAVACKGNDLGGVLSVALLALGVALGVLLRRRPGRWARQVALPLNLALLVLVVLPLASVWRASGHEDTPRPGDLFATEIVLPAAGRNAQRPDIYFLLIDGLGQPAFIESGFPLAPQSYSAPFTERGFQVLRFSFANYPQTGLSVAATLNAGPIDEILRITDPLCRDRRVLAEVAGRSRVVRTLRDRGYRIVSFPSGYPLTRQPLADRRRAPWLDASFLEFYLLEDSVLPLMLPLLGKGPADVSYALQRGRLNYILDLLPAARDGIPAADPVFVFAHLLAPHPPFVFGPQGQALPSETGFGFADGDHWLLLNGSENRTYRKKYADQATWIVRRLTQAIDGVIAASARPKIIIVQGDHGPGSGLRWEHPEATDLNERFGIFNAWYVSDGRQVPLYEGMTAWNTFPMLFNTFFGADLPLLPDEFAFARMSEPYNFFPVER